ncbi:MAG: hypothetical protein ACRD0X_02080 [Thermoanaerobaculia bacterium]
MLATAKRPLADSGWSCRGEESPYYSLRPGHRQVLEGELDGEEIRLEITVLDEREAITVVTAEGEPVTVEARVVEEREFKDGELYGIARLLVCPVSSDERHLLLG